MQRLVYLLTSGLLGRLCISGEIAALDAQQWALVKEAIQFYYQAAPVIARGKSRCSNRSTQAGSICKERRRSYAWLRMSILL